MLGRFASKLVLDVVLHLLKDSDVTSEPMLIVFLSGRACRVIRFESLPSLLCLTCLTDDVSVACGSI